MKRFREYDAVYVSNYDGDTIRLTLSVQVTDEVRMIWVPSKGCRMARVDTDEMNDKRPERRESARKAQARVEELIGDPLDVLPPFRCRVYEYDKYGRPLVDVMLADGRTLAEVLITEGLGRPYDGGKRE